MDNTVPVVVSLEDLTFGTLPLDDLVQAFGAESLGILIVKDLPERYSELRKRVLSNSSHLANLSPMATKRLERPEAQYKVGWSCGTEKFPGEKSADTLKGSFFAKCTFRKKSTQNVNPFQYPDGPQFTHANVWPDEDLPEFQHSFKELCNLIIDVAALVAKACDTYAMKHVDGYQSGYLERIVQTSTTTAARLLHYFPASETSEDEGVGNWCAQHIDSSALTGLTAAMFVDEAEALPKGKHSGLAILDELADCPCPDAGLYIRSRNGKLIKVSIPKDCLAFQTGEVLQVVTGGNFKAVPHLVRGCRASHASGIARNTLAVFCQPSLHDKVGDVDYASFTKAITARNLNTTM